MRSKILIAAVAALLFAIVVVSGVLGFKERERMMAGRFRPSIAVVSAVSGE